MPTLPQRLTYSAVAPTREQLLADQGGKCALCGLPCSSDEAVLDHDHDTGRIRGLLHRSCNAAEGKISNAAARWGAKSSSYADIIPYLKNLVAYLENPPKNLIYPMHKSADEKKDDRNRKAREARAALKAKRELALQRRKVNDA